MLKKCDCGGKLILKKAQRYHYTESGVDNVYLDNLEIYECPRCGVRLPSIPRIKQVHAAIAQAIAFKPTSLSGSDARLLRKQLGLQQKEWAKLLRLEVETLSRMENGKQPIGTQTDSLIRFLYFRLLEERSTDVMPGPMAERIAAVSADAAEPIVIVNVQKPQAYEYQAA